MDIQAYLLNAAGVKYYEFEDNNNQEFCMHNINIWQHKITGKSIMKEEERQSPL